MFRQKENKTFLKVKILSKCSKNEIIGFENTFLKIRVKAVREKGKANKELIQFLSDFLEIPKKNISITTGKTSSLKTICFLNISEEKLKELIN